MKAASRGECSALTGLGVPHALLSIKVDISSFPNAPPYLSSNGTKFVVSLTLGFNHSTFDQLGAIAGLNSPFKARSQNLAPLTCQLPQRSLLDFQKASPQSLHASSQQSAVLGRGKYVADIPVSCPF